MRTLNLTCASAIDAGASRKAETASAFRNLVMAGFGAIDKPCDSADWPCWIKLAPVMQNVSRDAQNEYTSTTSSIASPGIGRFLDVDGAGVDGVSPGPHACERAAADRFLAGK